ncbi:MAG: metal/formaldehyde-sensitive transcriptional repressor [Bradyrhizobiaceae bacterium]|nr:metal/formaldehyde-sensitive transcriptional repressor [Bradyrhizobiaceae bacterium]
MTHTIRRKTKLVARVRRIRGQVDSLERALETEARCGELLHLLASLRGAMNGLMSEVLEDHIRLHMADMGRDREQRNEGAAELIDVVQTYLK